MRRKKHTEKEVHADVISVVSVRLREGYTIRDISLTKGKQLRKACLGSPSACSPRASGSFFSKEILSVGPCFRWVPAGGEAGVVVETQHAHRVLGSFLVAFGSRQEDDQGGGHDGGKLRHSARHQLHPEETHHQPVPHLCHPTLLEHASKVQNHAVFPSRHSVIISWRKGCNVWLSNCNQNATFALSVSTKPTRCWCIFNLLNLFQKIT